MVALNIPANFNFLNHFFNRSAFSEVFVDWLWIFANLLAVARHGDVTIGVPVFTRRAQKRTVKGKGSEKGREMESFAA